MSLYFKGFRGRRDIFQERWFLTPQTPCQPLPHSDPYPPGSGLAVRHLGSGHWCVTREAGLVVMILSLPSFLGKQGPLGCLIGDTRSHTYTGTLSCLKSCWGINIKSGNQPVFFITLLHLEINRWLSIDCKTEHHF